MIYHKLFSKKSHFQCFFVFSHYLYEDFDVEVVNQECGEDHIHLLISAKPTLDLPKYINILKGHSSREIRKVFKEELSDKLWGDAFWSPSYFIASAGNISVDTIYNYINNQRTKL